MRVLPGSFLTGYREDLLAAFDDGLRRARNQGRAAGVIFVLQALAELPGVARRLRLGEGGHRAAGGWGVDVRHAWRSLRGQAGLTAASVLILASGVGGVVAIYSVLYSVVLRPLPYAEPDRLAVLWTHNLRTDLPDGTSYLNYEDWRRRSAAFQDMALYFRPDFTTVTLSGGMEPVRVHAGAVSSNFFQILGVDAVLGRVFDPTDLDQDAALAVVSESLWLDHFGASSEALGASLIVDGLAHRVIGVVPDWVDLPWPATRLWTLHDAAGLARGPMGESRRSDLYVVLGRLRAGVSLEAARADMGEVTGALASEYPDTNSELGARVAPLLDEVAGAEVRRSLWLLFLAVVLVLLISSTNVAHLALVRGARRGHDLALRSALGATRTRLARQLVTESVMLAIAAGGLGLLLGTSTVAALSANLHTLPRADAIGLSPPAVWAACACTLLASLAFGLAPALLVAGRAPRASLATVGLRTTPSDRRLRDALVVGEVALAVVLLSGTGLLVRSARSLAAEDPGFDAEHVLVGRLNLGPGYASGAERDRFFQAVIDRTSALPRVESAGGVEALFLRRIPDLSIRRVGDPPGQRDAQPRLTSDAVYPGFFGTVGMRLLEGRLLEPGDAGRDAERVAVVNQAMAEAFWPGEDPVGKRFDWGDRDGSDAIRVVGVVSDIRQAGLAEPPVPHVFTPAGERTQWMAEMDLVLRTRAEPGELVPAVRAVIRQMDPEVPLSQVGTAWERYGDGLSTSRLRSRLLSLFAALATALAASGLYALLNETVVSRRKEIGIRMAMGADGGRIRAEVIRSGLRLTASGVVVGLLGGALLRGLLEGVLYGIEPTDPITFATVGAVLAVVAFGASWLPARLATSVDPVATLTSP